MDLVEFLRARLDEDEQPCEGVGEYSDCYMFSERRLRDVEAKRQIVTAYADALSIQNGFAEVPREVGTREALELACKALALPYADHPDYRPEWRPVLSGS